MSEEPTFPPVDGVVAAEGVGLDPSCPATWLPPSA